MKILFLVYHGFSEYSGISKKIHYQINGLRALKHQVHICTYDILPDGCRVRRMDGQIAEKFGKHRYASIQKKCSYHAIIQFAIENEIEFVYARSFHNANPFTIHLFHELKKHGIKTAIEIPTYPYDQEYIGFPVKTRLELKIDQLFRRRLAKETDAIVTFTEDKSIFGQRTIRISNGVEMESIPLKKRAHNSNDAIHFIGVAEVHYWHGFDRFIHGMGEYYEHGGTKDLFFHIVGGVAPCEMYNSEHAPGFHELAAKYGIGKRIIYHGEKFGKELDELFEQCDFAIGSLARHRCGITFIKTLKNREYSARGIPFIYSETDSDFDDMPYIIKAPADESAINIQGIIDFLVNNRITPSEIRASVQHLSWKEQMKKVIEQL